MPKTCKLNLNEGNYLNTRQRRIERLQCCNRYPPGEPKGEGGMNHQEKLLELLGVSRLETYSEPTTGEELMQTGQHFLTLFEKVKAQGDIHLQRLQDEMAIVLAEALQPEARKRFGVSDALAVRQVLSEARVTGDSQANLLSLAQSAISQAGLTQEQDKTFLELIKVLPYLLEDFIASETARLKLIPVESISEISRVLADMYSEDRKTNAN